MNSKTLACGAAGAALALAAPAFGQTVGAFFEVSNDLSPGQPSATVTLWVPVPGDLYAFSAMRFDALVADPLGALGGAAWSDPVLLEGLDDPGTNPGTIGPDGTVVFGALPGQLEFPSAGYFADPSNPIAVWAATITVSDFSAREIDLATDIDRYDAYLRMGSPMSVTRAIGDARASVAVVPAPGVAVAFGLGLGFAGFRRRR
jgi:hypothetical protein